MNQQERIDWLKERRSGIGGSDVSAILGLNRFKGPIDVYLSKIEDGEPEAGYPNDYAEWGSILETPIADWFGRKHEDWKVVAPDKVLYRHEALPFMIASPDRIIELPDGTKQLLEIKTASFRQLKDYQDGKIPDAYVLQIQHTLNVVGLSVAYLAVLVGGQHYFEFRIDKDPMLCAEVENRMAEFWKMVEARTPPVLDGTETCTRALEKIYPSSKKDIKKEPELEKWVREYKAADIAMKECEVQKIAAGNHIRNIIGTSEAAEFGKCFASWKEQTRKTVDLKELKKKYPAIAKELEKETTSRVLRVELDEEK